MENRNTKTRVTDEDGNLVDIDRDDDDKNPILDECSTVVLKVDRIGWSPGRV